MRNNLGYTLVEITVTTAIVGTLTAIAVPNFLRVKMNVNMEMIEQHLRIMGQNMNELYNQSSPHEFPDDIFNMDGNPVEELSITASLNAIRGMGITDITYNAIRFGGLATDFTGRFCPGEGLWNIAADRCWLWRPSGFTRIMPWDGAGLAMIIFDNAIPPGALDAIFNWFLAEPTMTEDQRAQLVADFLEYSAYVLLNRQLADGGGLGNSTDPLLERMPATLFKFADALGIAEGTNQRNFENLVLPKAYDILEDRGIKMANKMVTVAGSSWNGDPVRSWKDPSSGMLELSNCGASCIGQGSFAQVGFEYEDSVKNPAAVRAKLLEAGKRYRDDRMQFLGF